MPETWVKQLVEETLGGSPVTIGHRYEHPEHGVIEIVSGRYWGDHGLSNHWSWRVLATGEIKSGYGGNWPEVDGSYRDSRWPLTPADWSPRT